MVFLEEDRAFTCSLFQAQAEQRAVALKEELNRRRRDLQERLENERQDREIQVCLLNIYNNISEISYYIDLDTMR